MKQTDDHGLNPNPDYDFSNRFGGFTKSKSTLQFDGRTLPLRKYSFLMSRYDRSIIQPLILLSSMRP